MAAMFSRSNGTLPFPSLNQDIEPGQIPLGVSHSVAIHEYSAQQLLDFLLEARNQEKPVLPQPRNTSIIAFLMQRTRHAFRQTS
jgi:hypothetical protein